jgi:hypothetical protein
MTSHILKPANFVHDGEKENQNWPAIIKPLLETKLNLINSLRENLDQNKVEGTKIRLLQA